MEYPTTQCFEKAYVCVDHQRRVYFPYKGKLTSRLLAEFKQAYSRKFNQSVDIGFGWKVKDVQIVWGQDSSRYREEGAGGRLSTSNLTVLNKDYGKGMTLQPLSSVV